MASNSAKLPVDEIRVLSSPCHLFFVLADEAT